MGASRCVYYAEKQHIWVAHLRSLYCQHVNLYPNWCTSVRCYGNIINTSAHINKICKKVGELLPLSLPLLSHHKISGRIWVQFYVIKVACRPSAINHFVCLLQVLNRFFNNELGNSHPTCHSPHGWMPRNFAGLFRSWSRWVGNIVPSNDLITKSAAFTRGRVTECRHRPAGDHYQMKHECGVCT